MSRDFPHALREQRRLEVLVRDQKDGVLLCEVCNEPIDLSVDRRAAAGYSLDHRDGDKSLHDLDNLGPTHMRCNVSKARKGIERSRIEAPRGGEGGVSTRTRRERVTKGTPGRKPRPSPPGSVTPTSDTLWVSRQLTPPLKTYILGRVTQEWEDADELVHAASFDADCSQALAGRILKQLSADHPDAPLERMLEDGKLVVRARQVKPQE